MARPNDKLSADLVKTALEFHKAALWREIPADETFLVQLPDEETTRVIHIIGQMGEDFGLVMRSGRNALADSRWLITRSQREDVMREVRSEYSAVTFGRLERIPVPARRILDDAGFSGRREALAPTFFVLREMLQKSLPNRSQMRAMLIVMKTVLRARRDGRLETANLFSSATLPVYRVLPDGQTIKRSSESIPPFTDSELDEILSSASLKDFPATDGVWWAGERAFDALDRDGEPKPTSLFVVADAADSALLGLDRLSEDEFRVAGTVLLSAMREPGPGKSAGRPRAVIFVDALPYFHVLGPILERAGIQARHEQGIEAFEQVATRVAAQISVADGSGDSPDSIAPDSPPRTIEEWKALEFKLHRLEHDAAFEDDDLARDALLEFFGVEKKVEQVLAERPAPELAAFCEWFAIDRFLGNDTRTLLDDWIEAAHDESVRTLLLARRRSSPSFFRIESTDRDRGRLALIDVFDGTRSTLIDFALARSAEPGWIATLRLFETPVGTFGSFAGPVISPLQFDSVIRFFDSYKTSFSREALTKEPTILGDLFVLLDEANERPPRITQNTDGELLALQTVSFVVSDRKTVLAALSSHSEIEHDSADPIDPTSQEDVRFVWLREPKKGRKNLGGPTLLARINVGQFSMTAEVNSNERAKRIKKILAAVRGVAYVTSEQHALSVDPVARPNPVNKPAPEVPSSPELMEALSATLRKLHLGWLDERVPALGNKTPRQCAKTPEGQAKVAAMIRTLPSTEGPGGIQFEPPRAEMLREIGIIDPPEAAAT